MGEFVQKSVGQIRFYVFFILFYLILFSNIQGDELDWHSG